MTLSTVKEPIIMDNEILNNEEEEETSILTLTDENGVDTDFEYLDCIPYQGKEYLVPVSYTHLTLPTIRLV